MPDLSDYLDALLLVAEQTEPGPERERALQAVLDEAEGGDEEEEPEQFCQEGENKGKPGPCPGPDKPSAPTDQPTRRSLPRKALSAAAEAVKGALRKPGDVAGKVKAAVEAVRAAYREGGIPSAARATVRAASAAVLAPYRAWEGRYGRKAALAMFGAYLGAQAGWIAAGAGLVSPGVMATIAPTPFWQLVGVAEGVRAAAKGTARVRQAVGFEEEDHDTEAMLDDLEAFAHEIAPDADEQVSREELREHLEAILSDGAEAHDEDAQGHEHKGKGPGGGQFTKKGGGGGEGESGKKEKKEGKPKGEKANKEGGEKPADPAANRPSRREERHEGAAPKALPFKAPPPKKKRAEGAPLRPTGDSSQTKLGDEAERLATALGMRSILPEGQRCFKPGEVADKGSSIDLEYDHSGRAYELKMCQTTASEYRLKAKAKEKEAKMEYARQNDLTAYTLVGVRDADKGEVHFYAAKEPGLIGAEVGPEKYDYLGKVKI